MSEIEPGRYLLNEAAARRIFEEEIVPEELVAGTPQAAPCVVFVAGQPGAGKTTTTEAVVDRLRERGTPVVVNSDFCKPYHPEYGRLLAEDDKTAAPYTSLDGRRWTAMAEHYLMDRRVDIVIETTMRSRGYFIEQTRILRDAGYQTEAMIMAVPEALSRFGIIARYHEQVQATGHGRFTPRANHDASYAGVLHAAAEIDERGLVDVVAVYRRGNELLCGNELQGPTQWKQPPGTVAAIEAERSQIWSIAQARGFLRDLQRLGEQLGAEWQPELRSIRQLGAAHLPPGVEAAVTAEPSFPGRAHPGGSLGPAGRWLRRRRSRCLTGSLSRASNWRRRRSVLRSSSGAWARAPRTARCRRPRTRPRRPNVRRASALSASRAASTDTRARPVS